jgi:hypothetical protein
MSILLYRLNQLPNVNILPGGWCGYWQVTLARNTRLTTFLMYRHHGAGGAAPVTKGIIDFQRMMSWQGDVDAIWIGHKHNKFVDLATKMTYSSKRNIARTKQVTCIMTGSYLSTYGTDEDVKPSYAMGWNLAPQQMGGVILELKQHEFYIGREQTLQTKCTAIL